MENEIIPNFRITLLGGNIFMPDIMSIFCKKEEITGIALLLRIRNGGADSIAVDWKLTVETPEHILHAAPIKAPPMLTLRSPGGKTVVIQESDFSLEDKAAQTPLKCGAPPIQGWLLFCVKLPQKEVLLDDTILKLTVEDFAGRTSCPAIQRIGDWPHF